MFDMFLESHKDDDQHKLNPDEEKKFRSAFEDEKFREILADYMDEISDPKHRGETEAYISQLEKDDKVPAGKELVRPEACFVVKTTIVPAEPPADPAEKPEKVFINVVSSGKIAKPTSTPSVGGASWRLPMSLGPKRFEADKSGVALVPTFDACFHPEALALARQQKQFKDYLVTTALAQVEGSLNALKPRSKPGVPALPDTVSKAYHILKGVTYKSGTPAIMMMAKGPFDDASDAGGGAAPSSAVGAAATRLAAQADAPVKTTGSAAKKPAPAASGAKGVPKGFLNKGSVAAAAPKKAEPAKAAAPEAAAKAVPKAISGVVEPTYRVTERGDFALANHMNGRVVQPTRPQEIEVSAHTHTRAFTPWGPADQRARGACSILVDFALYALSPPPICRCRAQLACVPFHYERPPPQRRLNGAGDDRTPRARQALGHGPGRLRVPPPFHRSSRRFRVPPPRQRRWRRCERQWRRWHEQLQAGPCAAVPVPRG